MLGIKEGKMGIIIIIIIILIIGLPKTKCMVLSSWLRAIARVHPLHLINAD